MGKTGFWKSDWFLGLVVTLVVIVASGRDLVQSLERKAYDLGVAASTRVPSDRVVVIKIDDESIANIGRWPWPRDVHAKMIDLLAGAKAKAIVYSVFFFEPQTDPGLVYINKLSEMLAGSKLRNEAEGAQFDAVLKEAADQLDTDKRLAASIKQAGNVLLPFVLQPFPAEPQGRPDKPLAEYMAAFSLPMPKGDDLPLPGVNPVVPIPAIGMPAAALGHLNAAPDVDGAVRSEPLMVRYFDRMFPALSLMAVAKSLNLGVADIQVRPGEDVTVGKLKVRTDPELLMNTFWYADKDGKPPFAVDSFFDVLTGKVPAAKFQDKIVLIGATAAGVGTAFVTPYSSSTPPVLSLAHAVSSILKEDFYVRPGWAPYAEILVFLLVAAYLIAVLPRLKAAPGALTTAGILVALIAVHFALMAGQLLWLKLMAAATLLVVGHLALTTKRFLMTERGKQVADADLIVTNRNLGLAEQGRGNLDAAYDYFRRLPKEERGAELLYNLALDFERKRQFNKAEAVLRYIAEWAPKFKDVEARANRSKTMSETVILGGASSHPGGTMVLNAGEKPMLGRFQVEKELGKGAMGVVYQGTDPKIGRVVAIKTMAFSQEFEADELVEVKERFFREAQTAGRLNHPNIVTIFDTGEEHDLAYIAMEFLKGRDLAPFTKPDNLMPLPKVMSIVMRVADALNYAHSNNVVHRDIKPANIMYEPDSDVVKVTDFGIARITDSSKTKTGMVLGTPSYMSPEQLAGRKIEGRSDLFSLGVMLYQMSCGKLPFEGDSMAQLMFKIANEPHADITQYNPALPDCLYAIIEKALAKQPEARYQTGEEMASALRQCLDSLKQGAVDITL